MGWIFWKWFLDLDCWMILGFVGFEACMSCLCLRFVLIQEVCNWDFSIVEDDLNLGFVKFEEFLYYFDETLISEALDLLQISINRYSIQEYDFFNLLMKISDLFYLNDQFIHYNQ